MRQVGILGAALAVALIATYATWFDDGTSAPREGVEVLSIAEGALSSLAWSARDVDVEITESSDADGSWLTVAVTRYERPDADKDTDATPADPVDEEREVQEVLRFVGNDSAKEVWSAMTPLVALRTLGPAEPDRLKPFDLEEPQAELTLTWTGGESTLSVGGESFGTRDRYATVDGEVVLLDDKTLRPLQFARTRLMERALHPFAEGDLTTVTIRDPEEGDLTLTHRNADDRAKAYWSSDAVGERKDTTAGTWIDKLLRMRLRGWPSPEEDPPDATSLFHVDLTGRDGTTWSVEVLRSAEDGKAAWWARSSWLRGLVELTPSMAEDVEADVSSLYQDRDAPSDDTD